MVVRAPADPQGHFLICRQGQMPAGGRRQSPVQGCGISPLTNGQVEQFGQITGFSGYRHEGCIQGANPGTVNFDYRFFRNHQDFVEVGLANMPPSLFFVQRLKQLLDPHESVAVRDEAEFVRSAPQKVDQEFGEFVDVVGCF